MSTPDIRYEKLPNGLTVLLRETHLSPLANLQIWSRVGSADERPGEEGLAHFHEHMLFKGTERRGVGEVAGEVEGAGGRINAYTSFDVTVYYATLPSVALPTGLDVLSDAVQHSIFDAEELAREQEVVIEEIHRSADSPGHVLGDLMFREAYKVHPYHAPILGTEESVSGLGRDKIIPFFERWYAPDNLTVVAAGDFDSDALLAQIGAAFGDATPRGAVRERPTEPVHNELNAAVLRSHFETQRIELCWPSARFRDDDATYLDLLSFLLGECESSRLVLRLRENEGLVDRIDSSSYTPFDRGLFAVSLDSDEARSRRAIEAVAEEIERLRVEPVTAEELERARNNFLASELFERESVSGLASKLGSFEVLGGDWRGEERYFETLRAATVEDLQRVAQQYLSPEQLTAAALIPDKKEETLDERALESAVMAGVDRTRSRFAVPKKLALPERRRSATPGEVGAPAGTVAKAPRAGDEIHSYELGHGAMLHVAPRRELPVVATRAAFSGGLLADTADESGLSCFVASMWNRGTKHHTNAGFARAVEDLAAEINGFSGRSSMGVNMEVTAENLQAGLDLFAEVLLEPGFDEDEIERERRETLAAIDRREDQLAQRAFALFQQTEFETHPYRLSIIGEHETVERFDADMIRARQASVIQLPNMVLSVAGDVDPDEIAAAMSSRLSGLSPGPFTLTPPAPEPERTGVREEKWSKDRAQAHLVMGFRGLTVDDPDRYVLEVISQLLAGQGGRLFLDLRDKRSLAYSVSAMNVEGVAPGFFAVYIATAPEKLDEAKSGINEHLERLINEAPDADELGQTIRHLTGNYAIDQQRNAARAAHIALDSLYGLGPREHLAYPSRIEAVTTEDVLRVAQRVVRMDAYTLAVVAP